MKYKIIVTCLELSIAEKIYELIRKSEIYNSKEIVILSSIKEVCSECSHKEM